MQKDAYSFLLIDDHKYMRGTVYRTVGIKPDQVKHALEPGEALVFAQTQPFNLFLIDYQFGIDVADDLRRQYPHIPQIMITAYRTDAVVNACRQLKIPLIEKPFLDDTLKDTVHFYLELSQQPQWDWQAAYLEWEKRWGSPDEPMKWALPDHDYMFAQMWSDHAKDAVKKTARIVTPREEAEDIVVQSYCELALKNIRFKNGHHFRAYFLKTMLRKALNWLKKKKPDSGGHLPEVVDDSPSPFDTLANQQMLAEFEVMLQQLPEKDRTILQLYRDAFSHREIAARLNLSVANVRQRIHRVVEKLKNILESKQ